MNISQLNYLVTGGAGFIGSHVCEQLISLGNSVFCVDNFDSFYAESIKRKNIAILMQSPNFKLIEGDIRDKDLMQNVFSKHKIDVVIHLAAKAGVRPSVEQPEIFYDVNVNGTLILLNAMKKFGVNKLVFSSSSSVYGNNKKVPFAEIDNVDFPISPYAASKKACELYNYTYHHLYGISVVNLRFFTVYGPRQRPDLAIHKFFKLLNQNKPIDIFGDGSTGRDYTFIEDIVAGILAASQYIQSKDAVYEIINLGNSSPVKLNELIETIEKIATKKFEKRYLPMQEGDVDLTFADIAKAQKLLGYKPKVSLEMGLTLFKNWLESN